MSGSKTLTGPCSHCGATLEFPAEQIGQPTLCPHCRLQTELTLGQPPSQPVRSRKLLLTASLGIGFMLLCLALALLGSRWASRWAAEHPQLPPASSSASPASSRQP